MNLLKWQSGYHAKYFLNGNEVGERRRFVLLRRAIKVMCAEVESQMLELGTRMECRTVAIEVACTATVVVADGFFLSG